MDLAITGQNRSGEAQSLVYENSTSGLSITNDANIQPLQNGDAAWGDADNDGDLDLVVLGEDSFENRGGALYLADSDGGQWNLSLGSELQNLSSSSADWGDVDNDGDLDLALLGQSDDVIDGVIQSYTRVLINDGLGDFEDGDFGLEGLNNGEVAFADMDGDGDLDVAANGSAVGGDRRFILARNESGSLINVEQTLTALESSDLAWGDVDGDGDMDLAVGGIAETGVTTEIYTNDGNGDFTLLDGVQLTGMRGGDIVWGDYDNDQDLDLVLAGNNGEAPFLQIYENTDSGFEIENILVLTGVDFSSLALVDHDGDGDLDLFSAGRDARFSPSTTINDNLESQFNRNTNPRVPVVVGAVDSASTVRLTWELGLDDNDSTPQSLTYNVRVGTARGADDVLSGNQAVGPGSAGNNLFQDLNGLSSGTYYWSVQAVDDGWARSGWSDPASFIVDTIAPTIAGVNLSKNQVGIGQTLTLALQILDEHSGLDPTRPPAVTASIGDSVIAFQQLQFTADTWTGELTITSEHPSGNATLSVSGARDRRLNTLARFDSTDVFLVDTQTPRLIASEPSDGASEIPATTSQVTLTFSEPIDPLGVTADNFVIRLGVSPLAQLTDPSYDADARRVTLLPEGGLLPGSTYEVEVSAAIADLVGNRPDNASIVRFSTRVPALLSTVPPDNEIGTSLEDGRLTATFDTPILTGLLAADPNAVQVLAEDEAQPLLETPVFSAENNTLSFALVDGLKPGTRYQVVLASLLGGTLRLGEGDYSWSFQTPVPNLSGSVPAEGDTTVLASTTALVLQFDNPVDGSALTAEAVAVLEGGEQRAIQTLEYNPETQTVRIEAQGGLRAGSSYTVRLPRAIGGPQRDGPYALRFSTAVPRVVSLTPEADAQGITVDLDEASVLFSVPIDADKLTAENFQLLRGAELLTLRPGDPVDRGDGRYGLAPEAGWNAGSAYRVRIAPGVSGPLGQDRPISWRFETAIPRVVDVEPDSNAVDVAVSQVEATVQFTVPIDADQVVAENFTISRDGVNLPLRPGDPVDRGDARYGLAPEAGWNAGSAYRVRIAPGVSGPLGLGQPISWRFDTAIPRVVDVEPDSNAVDVPVSQIEATVQFTVPIDADQVVAENFTIARDGVNLPLRSGDPVDRGDGRYAFAPEAGWNAGSAYRVRIAPGVSGPLGLGQPISWRFDTAIPRVVDVESDSNAVDVPVSQIEATVQFTVPIDADQVVAENFTIARDGVNLPLRSGDPVDRGDGRYAFAPEAGWNAGSAYRVRIAPGVSGPLGLGQPISWRFDTAIPRVVDVEPDSNAVDVAVSQVEATVQFTVPIDADQVVAENFTIAREGVNLPLRSGDPVDRGAGRYGLAPASGWQVGSRYNIQIAPGVSGPLGPDIPVSWQFQTDVPALASVAPASGDTSISDLSMSVAAVFDSPLDETALLVAGNVSLLQQGTSVDLLGGGPAYNSNTNTVTLAPVGGLRAGTNYRVQIASVAGGPLQQDVGDFAWEFSTRIPDITRTVPGDEATITSGRQRVQVVFTGPISQDLITPQNLRLSQSGDSLPLEASAKIEMSREVLGQLAESGFSFRFRTAARLANAALGGTITNPEGSVELYFPPNALEGGTSEVLIRPAADPPAKRNVQDSELTRISRAFAISAPGATLRKPVTLTVAYSGDESAAVQDPSKLAVFVLSGGVWGRVGGVADASSRKVTTAIDELGTFAIFQDLRTQVGKLAIRQLDCQPRAFAPGGTRFKRETDISFDLTGPANVTVRVYNASGRLERVIVRDRALAPGRASFEWDGRDEDRNTVSSGLYIVVVNAGDTKQEKVVAVIK